MPGLPNLQGKRVLVTGAASGIGASTARAFARQGAHVIVTDISHAPLQALADELAAAGAQCSMYVVDVANAEAMRDLATEVVRSHGPLDVLINNAGIGYIGSLRDTPLAVWRRCLDINLLGVVHGCHSFLPVMLAAGGARRIVNVASAAAYGPVPNMSTYAASKWGVMGLSEVLDMELEGTDVGVTIVCPGIINTAITADDRAVSPAIRHTQIEKLRAYYAREGAHPDVVANDIVRAVRRGESLVLTGPYARLAYWLKRLSRRLARRITLSTARTSGYME